MKRLVIALLSIATIVSGCGDVNQTVADKPVVKVAQTAPTVKVQPPKFGATDLVLRWVPTVKREAQAVFGINAPVPMKLGQIRQESGGRENVTAWDNGRGLAQFMDATARDVAKRHPELGAPDPYNPKWAIRAMVRLNHDNYRMVNGKDDCQRWAAALKCYNAGCGYVVKAQRASPDPGKWFDVTEHVPTRQSAKNFEYSRLYPRWILFKHQPRYTQYGPMICLNDGVK